jgi:hypothetical protein
MEDVGKQNILRLGVWLALWWLGVRWSGELVLRVGATPPAVWLWLGFCSLLLSAVVAQPRAAWSLLLLVGWSGLWFSLRTVASLPLGDRWASVMELLSIVIGGLLGYLSTHLVFRSVLRQ